VQSGDAARMVVVAVDDIGDVAHRWAEAVGAPLAAGAVALLVSADKMATSVAKVVSTHTSLGPGAAPAPSAVGAVGHAALVPLAALAPPAGVEAASFLLGTVARARVAFAAI
jgi:hypothetical protein